MADKAKMKPVVNALYKSLMRQAFKWDKTIPVARNPIVMLMERDGDLPRISSLRTAVKKRFKDAKYVSHPQIILQKVQDAFETLRVLNRYHGPCAAWAGCVDENKKVNIEKALVTLARFDKSAPSEYKRKTDALDKSHSVRSHEDESTINSVYSKLHSLQDSIISHCVVCDSAAVDTTTSASSSNSTTTTAAVSSAAATTNQPEVEKNDLSTGADSSEKEKASVDAATGSAEKDSASKGLGETKAESSQKTEPVLTVGQVKVFLDAVVKVLYETQGIYVVPSRSRPPKESYLLHRVFEFHAAATELLALLVKSLALRFHIELTAIEYKAIPDNLYLRKRESQKDEVVSLNLREGLVETGKRFTREKYSIVSNEELMTRIVGNLAAFHSGWPDHRLLLSQLLHKSNDRPSVPAPPSPSSNSITSSKSSGSLIQIRRSKALPSDIHEFLRNYPPDKTGLVPIQDFQEMVGTVSVSVTTGSQDRNDELDDDDGDVDDLFGKHILPHVPDARASGDIKSRTRKPRKLRPSSSSSSTTSANATPAAVPAATTTTTAAASTAEKDKEKEVATTSTTAATATVATATTTSSPSSSTTPTTNSEEKTATTSRTRRGSRYLDHHRRPKR